jgi:hypothetical protein
VIASVLFVAFAVTVKDVRQLADQAPWGEDPYDALFSFAIFFVPAILGLLLLRLPLCRASESIPVSRVIDVVRACRLSVGIVLGTLVAGWMSVAASISVGTSPTARLLIAGLGLESRLSLGAARSMGNRQGPDWLADASALATQLASRLGAESSSPRRQVAVAGRTIEAAVRSSPFKAALVAALAFGAFVALGALFEGDPPILGLLLGVVGTGGMLAFLVTAGTYLGLVRTHERSRRLPDGPISRAAFVSVATLPVTVAFRDSLWWLAGSNPDAARTPELAGLLGLVAVTIFLLAIVIQAAFTQRRVIAQRRSRG